MKPVGKQPCRRCGQMLQAGARFCPVCGQPVVADNEQPADTTQVVQAARGRTAERAPSPAVVAPVRSSTAQTHPLWWVGLGVGIAAVIGGLIFVVATAGDRSSSEAQTAAVSPPTAVVAGSTTISPNPPTPSPPPPSPAASVLPSSTTTVPTTTSAPPQAGAANGEDEPSLAALSVGHWIVIHKSIPQPDGTASAESFLRSIRSFESSAELLDSNDYASLKRDFWVVFYGPFATRDAALSHCYALGRDVDHDCYPKLLSHNADDADK
jgi:hypothetical protein